MIAESDLGEWKCLLRPSQGRYVRANDHLVDILPGSGLVLALAPGLDETAPYQISVLVLSYVSARNCATVMTDD
jgi:hypothetical protein